MVETMVETMVAADLVVPAVQGQIVQVVYVCHLDVVCN